MRNALMTGLADVVICLHAEQPPVTGPISIDFESNIWLNCSQLSHASEGPCYAKVQSV